ncbi:MAG: sulfate reduction electron transfer complex DsrMKJOP subunit DsrM [Desulfovibrionaceae bacterium]|jgi:nitrate reductase gamma subunit|nr:sulfate reduction electron transfer complex DsrMKJOP subunit DsrM [Desulfovibrionaceae bacterium]
MAAFLSIIIVIALGAGAYYGAGSGLRYFLGAVLPYAAVAIFVLGFVYRVLDWAKSPVPFSIPTTGGQQKSFDWIPWNRLDNPATKAGTVGRMLLEVLLFRSLFRNNTFKVHPGPKVSYPSAKWLWLFALLFHYSFLTIFIRHFRFFLEPVPFLISGIETLDGLFQIGAPRLYQTDIVILAALLFLLGRRFFNSKVNYISLLGDYFPLFLIIGICSTGIWMRYFGKTDIAAVKELTMGLVTFAPIIPESVGAIFFIHLALVCTLLIYFPFSKLMHMGGVFMSPTRNMPNNTRFVRHENPWNPPAKYHTYEAYEDDFREAMFEAGIRVDKLPEAPAAETE